MAKGCIAVCVGFALVISTETCAYQEDGAGDDLSESNNAQRALQGEWWFASEASAIGTHVLLDHPSDWIKLCVSGQRIRGIWNGTVFVKAGTNGSQEIDLFLLRKDGRKEMRRGICENNEDRLTITIAEPNQERPNPDDIKKKTGNWRRYTFIRKKEGR